MWRRPVAAAALALAAVLSGCSGSAGSPPPAGVGITFVPAGARPRMPALSGSLLGGGRLSTAGWRGRVYAVNFWGSWCAPCRSEAPALQAAAARLAGEGVRLLGVDISDTAAAAQSFRRRLHLSYPSLFDPNADLSLLIRSYPLVAAPTTYVVDRNGRLAAVIYGATTYRPFLSLLQRVAHS